MKTVLFHFYRIRFDIYRQDSRRAFRGDSETLFKGERRVIFSVSYPMVGSDDLWIRGTNISADNEKLLTPRWMNELLGDLCIYNSGVFEKGRIVL